MAVRIGPNSNITQGAYDGTVAYTAAAVTTAPMTRYVATTGSDASGTGAVGAPYATPGRAYADFPRTRLHLCKILMAAGTYAGSRVFPRTIVEEAQQEGFLEVCGVGAPVVQSGPHTVNAATDRGTVGLELEVTGAAWVEDELIGQFVMVTSAGTRQGMAFRVLHNTADTIVIQMPLDPVQAADVFNLVTPAVVINFSSDEAFVVDCRPAAPYTCDASTFDVRSSRIAFHNIAFNFAAPTAQAESLVLKGGQAGSGIYFDFCSLSMPVASVFAIAAHDTAINPPYEPPASVAYIADGGTGITNLATLTYGTEVGLTVSNGGGGATQRDLYVYGEVSLAAVALQGVIYAQELGAVFFETCSVGAGETYGASFSGNYLYFVGAGGVDCLTAYSSYVQISEGYFYQGQHAIHCRTNGRFWVELLECDPVLITSSAAHLGACVMFHHEGAMANFIGASLGGDKAYELYAKVGATVKSNSWPGANGTGATDGLGTFVTRHD